MIAIEVSTPFDPARFPTGARFQGRIRTEVTAVIDVADHASGQNICIGAAMPGQVIVVSGGSRLATLEIFQTDGAAGSRRSIIHARSSGYHKALR